jgi:hypothetical protein
MRSRFEFAFVEVTAGRDPGDDPSLAMLGSQGWELRSIALRAAGDLAGNLIVALQRPLDEEHPLAESAALAATLESPLHAPGPGDFDTV